MTVRRLDVGHSCVGTGATDGGQRIQTMEVETPRNDCSLRGVLCVDGDRREPICAGVAGGEV